MPRGPMSSAESLAALVLGVGVGVLTGWLMASRWAALLAPATFGAAFEIGRIRAVGPTVDAIRLDGFYGILALVVGRGFDVLVIGLPMVVAAFWGAALARRQKPRRSNWPRDGLPVAAGGSAFWRAARGTSLVLATVIVVGLGAAWPARPVPPPSSTRTATPFPGSIAELTTVRIGGHDQSIMLRGNDVDAPVLLFLEGGPGGTALGSMRYAGQQLEEHFMVATWDQRGTGKSASALEPLDTLTVAQAVADTIEVTEYLRDRFDEKRIYLLGSSWGTTLGTLAVQARPDLFHAYIGSGQMVDQQETDKLMYAESVAYAERVGDTGFAEQLRAIGPPPYTDMLAYPVAIASNPEWHDFEHGRRPRRPLDLPGEPARRGVHPDREGPLGRRADRHLRAHVPAAPGRGLPPDAPASTCPSSSSRASTRPRGGGPGIDWFEQLQRQQGAGHLRDSGHTPHLHEPGRFANYLADVVLPQTYPRRDGA